MIERAWADDEVPRGSDVDHRSGNLMEGIVLAVCTAMVRSEFFVSVALRSNGRINLPLCKILHRAKPAARPVVTAALTAPQYRRRLIGFRLARAAAQSYGVTPDKLGWALPLNDAGLGLVRRVAGYSFVGLGSAEVVPDGSALREDLRRDRRRLRASCRRSHWSG
jgi:hypothetical protein